ncbi:FecR family protein [Engelhardtia mirabilis]|uniref:FecR protein n=1 Tax=Engelhardtia mirabilis TaxID=2528011 RepID=A0A518BIT0_9BACT|nr:FecR protein [Planctomycetes bacterium Pla133]QDV01218.1 FecR protein [Planctomycetes bacterium Pla86]
MERRLREILAREGAREGFAKALRASFVSGQFEGEAVLRGAPAAGADPEFRAELRAGFAGGSLESGGEGELPQALSSGLAPALSSVPSDGGFRAQLKARFVLGELEVEGAGGSAPAGEAAPIHDLAAARAGTSVRRRPTRHLSSVAALLVAAVALFAFVLPTFLGPDWLVRHAPIEATSVLFDRTPLDPSVQRLDVETGRVLACGPEALRLALDDRALVEAAPNSQVRFCAPVQRIFADALAPVHLDKGELNVRTLPGGAVTLTIDTPNAMIRLRDGAVSVLATDKGTCICVLEGQVEVSPAQGGAPRVVHADERIFVPLGKGSCQFEVHLSEDPHLAEGERLERMRRMLVDIDAGVF